MKNVLVVSVFIVFLSFFGCATTQQAGNNDLNKLSSEEVEAYNNNPAHLDKIVCTTVEEIGSRLPKKVCHSASSIAERAKRDQEALQRIQSGVITNAPKGGG